MSRYPEPLTLSGDGEVHAALAEHFGAIATASAVAVLGVTSPGIRHPTIHRAGIEQPRVTACRTTSHGTENLIAQVVAVTDNDAAAPVIARLVEAGIEPCRMCHRCWGRHLVPSHEVCALIRP